MACAQMRTASACTRCGADQRKQFEQLCRYINRPALANERLSRNAKGQVVLKLKSAYPDSTAHIVMHPQDLMQPWPRWSHARGYT